MNKLIEYIAENNSKKELAEVIVELYTGKINMSQFQRFVHDFQLEMDYEEEKANEVWRDMQKTYQSLERF
jgi:hypothetical protein